MPDQEFEYDVFLSYTEANKAEAQNLYERLRNEAIRVFFAEETIPPGGNITLGVMDALRASRKVAIIMTPAYFSKTWPRAEFAAILNKDPENKDRRLIPLLFESCDIPDLIAPLKYLDFRNADDRDLRFRQLLQALDLPRREFAQEEEFEFREHELELSRRGRLGYVKGKRFEDEVATLYRLLGFEVKQDTQLSGVQIDLQIQQKIGGLLTQAIVECKDKRITANERDQILAP